MAWVNGKSGTYNISTNNAPISGYVYWSERYDIANNKSEISQVAYLHRTNIYSGETYFYSGTVSRTAYFGSETVATTVVTDMSIPGNTSSSGGAYVQVYSAVKEIPHNADGTKSITLGFSMSNNVGGVAGNSFTVPKTTATVSLTTIPRATKPTLSATSVAMGSTMRITLTPADSSFKHKIRYEFGSLVSQVEGLTSGVDFTSQGTTYHDFTPPTSLGNQIPNATSGTAKLIIYTYRSDGTHVGTETTNITINVPSYTPSISNVALTGNSLLSGSYVQGKSTVKVAIAASSLYGATIKSYSATVDGKTYSGSSFTSAVLSSGSKTVVVTVTDTRGKTATYTSAAFTVYAYSVPNISAFALSRQSDGTTVTASVSGSVSSVNGKNTINVTVILNGTTKGVTLSKTTANGIVTFIGSVEFTGISTDSTFTGTAKVVDSYDAVSKEAVLPTVAVTMDFYKTGKGVAFGKVAEGETLDVAWEIKTGQPAKTLSNLSFRGTNLVNSEADNTIANWSNQGNLATTFYNDASPITKPSTWGFLVNVTTGQGTTEAHQLWLEQSNGNMHHRGGNQSGFGNWRKILDDSNCADYVIERTTTDGWEITKWNSGKIEMFAEKSLSFPATTQQTTYLWRSIVSLDLSKYLTKIMSGTCSIQVNGMVPQVCRHSSTHTLAEIVIVSSRDSGAFTITAPVYIIGKWK